MGSTMHGTSTLLARSAWIAAICCIVVFPSTADAQLPNINIQDTCRAAAAVMVNLMGAALVGRFSQSEGVEALEGAQNLGDRFKKAPFHLSEAAY
jgi:hypothetical protein